MTTQREQELVSLRGCKDVEREGRRDGWGELWGEEGEEDGD